MPSGVRKRRKGVSRTTAAFAVVIIIIIIGVGIFMLLSAGGLANIGIGGNGTTSNVPAYVGFTTTNSTLKSHLMTPFFGLATPYRLEPNTNYTFPVTIILVNSNGNEIQNAPPIKAMLDPGGYPPGGAPLGTPNGYGGIIAYFNPSSGVPPFNTTLVIITGSNITYAPTEGVTTNITLTHSNSAFYWIFVSNTTWDLEGYPD
ncbi:MAG: hypothetical protein JRM78_01885 [Nitrososphaerota archaeon]|jgi:hypothetical protein|nr:hypothetical protein [Nitrososphaerota archaeon]MDG7040953.1 hypothetical protein [Nitrososphaerota archaeon]MDG7042653.1 hypothetical protein [Nitrososphaerota archaeon]